ncbi:MAG: ATPase domain-containing protein [Deltaproteobacteria bacterium]|nr:ATPase domain-containing protein [Deltaproteobacteria bacterium]
MTKTTKIARLPSGVDNLDGTLHGGFPKGSLIILSGAPGAGKTTLAQQICFHNASPAERVLFFSTLSEPTAKSLRFLHQFSFFDAKKVKDGSVTFVDLGVMLRTKGLSAASALILEHLKAIKPAVVVIDSFKVFDDLATSKEELRKFGYEIAINLMAWETTAFLLGEYGPADLDSNPFFSIVDGVVVMSQQVWFGEQQRFLRTVKMRGSDHSREEHPFLITAQGVEVFAPRVAIRRGAQPTRSPARCKTHISNLDELLGPGIPWGSSLLVAGVAGTGKTVLSLEFIYRGALAGEKGILFSFEETDERLRAAGHGLGWDLDREIQRGMIEIVFIPQPDITVEAHLLMMRHRIDAMKARRVVIDSVSVFLHKVADPQISREKIFHLCSIVQNAGAVGLFPTDIPYGSRQVSRFGVEETVVDGVIILSSTEEGLDRERYIEIYKLRNTAHLKGRHNMVIGGDGVSVFPRYGEDVPQEAPPPALAVARLGSGVPGLDALLAGGLLKRSVTLISGSAGVGKTVLSLHFLLEGARKKERGLYVTLEEGPEQLLASADALGLSLRAALKKGLVEILYISRDHIRAGQFLTVLADKLKSMKASRVVLDAATQMLTEQMEVNEFRHVLYKLVVRFKTLDITSVVTLEAPSLVSTDHVTQLGLSPVADNLLMLRYKEMAGQLNPTLTIVKTRGSHHDRGTHAVVVGAGGMRVGPQHDELPIPPVPLAPPARGKRKKRPR